MIDALAQLSPDIRFMLEAAVKAPSGDNDQPWLWKVRGETVELWHSSKHSQYKWDIFRRGGTVCLGAALENFCIAATARGHRADVAYSPSKNDSDHVATITLSKDASVAVDPLAASVQKRATNRRPYQKKALTAAETTALLQAEVAAWGTLRLTAKPEEIRALAKAAAVHEQVIFSNKELHHFFFGTISWTRREDAKRRLGFYLPSFELPAPARLSMHLFRHWCATYLADFIGIQKFIAFIDQLTYRSSAAFGMISAHSASIGDLTKAGRLMERVWLTVVSQDLYLQPMTGSLMLDLTLQLHEKKFLNEKQTNLVVGAYNTIKKIFGIDAEVPIFMFRVGHAPPPSVHSLRLPLQEVVEVLT